MSRLAAFPVPGRAGTSAKASPSVFMMSRTVVGNRGDRGGDCREVVENYGELVGEELFYVGVNGVDGVVSLSV